MEAQEFINENEEKMDAYKEEINLLEAKLSSYEKNVLEDICHLCHDLIESDDKEGVLFPFMLPYRLGSFKTLGFPDVPRSYFKKENNDELFIFLQYKTRSAYSIFGRYSDYVNLRSLIENGSLARLFELYGLHVENVLLCHGITIKFNKVRKLEENNSETPKAKQPVRVNSSKKYR